MDGVRWKYVRIETKVYERDVAGYDEFFYCGGCGIRNQYGNIHRWGCPVERCPLCHSYLKSCTCGGTKLPVYSITILVEDPKLVRAIPEGTKDSPLTLEELLCTIESLKPKKKRTRKRRKKKVE